MSRMIIWENWKIPKKKKIGSRCNGNKEFVNLIVEENTWGLRVIKAF